jgi:hypothetical protein
VGNGGESWEVDLALMFSNGAVEGAVLDSFFFGLVGRVEYALISVSVCGIVS